MKKDRFVGLIIMARFFDTSNNGKLQVVLQRIGRWDFRNKVKLDFPGCCKISAHTKLEEDETYLQALERKLRQDFGDEFTKIVTTDNPSVREIFHDDKDMTEVKVFGVVVSEDDLKTIQLSPCTGGLDPVSKEEFEGNKGPVKVYDEMRYFGAHPAVVALFEDEIAAVRKAFEIYDDTKNLRFPSVLGSDRVRF